MNASADSSHAERYDKPSRFKRVVLWVEEFGEARDTYAAMASMFRGFCKKRRSVRYA